MLSRRPDYEIGIKQVEPAILWQEDDGTIVYNQQILAATLEIKDDEWMDNICKATTADQIVQEGLKHTNDYDKMKFTSDDTRLIYMHGLIYIPAVLWNKAIRWYHDMLIYGYQGTDKTVEHIS